MTKTGCIYNITVGELGFYIGSAESFDERLKTHKLKAKKTNYKIYKAIRDNGGEFVMTKLCDVEYENTVELRIQERIYYERLRPNLNTNRPYVTEAESIAYKKQWQIKNADKVKQWRIRNIDTVKAQQKQWQIKNADSVKVWQKQWQLENADSVKAYQKQHYIDNNVKVREKQKKYQIDNAVKIREKKNERITCECGCEISYGNSSSHRKTKKHINLMKNMELTNV